MDPRAAEGRGEVRGLLFQSGVQTFSSPNGARTNNQKIISRLFQMADVLTELLIEYACRHLSVEERRDLVTPSDILIQLNRDVDAKHEVMATLMDQVLARVAWTEIMSEVIRKQDQEREEEEEENAAAEDDEDEDSA